MTIPDPARPAAATQDRIDALSLDLATLARELRIWARRDDSKPQPEVRRSASVAVRCTDRMLHELHVIRAALVTGIRCSDDAAIARSGELLAAQETRSDGEWRRANGR